MGLVGEGAIVTSVLPDVFPVIDMEAMQPDGWRLAGWRTCAGNESRIPGAGLTPEVALENITTTGTLAVVEQIFVTASIDANIQIGMNTAGSVLAGVSNGFKTFRDRREPVSPPVPILSVTEGDAIPTGFRFFRALVLARSPMIYEPPAGMAVLSPGSMIIVQSVTADAILHVNYSWRERAIEPSETNP